MRVGIDVSPLVQTRAGTARHVLGLLGELTGRPGLELVGLEAGGTGRLASLRRDALWYPFRLGHASAELDVLHCTTFRAPVSPRAPLVVTVHDLAVLRHPNAFPRWHRLTGSLALRGAVRAADALVAVSAFTRDELVALLDVPVERIRVVPNGVDPVFTVDGPAAGGDYVLAVGTLEPRKNLAGAVEAARLAGVELRVAGAAGWGEVAAEGWVGEPSDDELAALMRGARCLVYPSLYEGFGLPVLEAMACGTPVVTTRGGATEEVAGGAAVLVDPHDAASIAAGIDEAERRRDSLVELGLARASMFTWRRSADLVWDLLARARVTLVAVDADVLGRQRTGDETYVRNLLRTLPAPAAAAGLRIAAVTRQPELVPEGVMPVLLPARSQEARMAWTLPRALRRLGAALVHTQYALPLRCPCPAVVTIHDLSFEQGLMSRRDRLVFERVVPRAARGAARVLTVSERTKRDLVDHYAIPPERVVVTPNGVDPAFHPAPGENEQDGAGDTESRAPYALAVGAIQERKNQLAALSAAREAGLELVVVGPTKDERLAARLREGGAHLEGYVPTGRLAELYRGAACLVQASRHEGFGLPVIEAMACGTPVVTVADAALVEVAAGAAVVVDETGLAEGIRRALAGRESLVAAGLERARAFSWERAAETTVGVYVEALAR